MLWVEKNRIFAFAVINTNFCQPTMDYVADSRREENQQE